MAGGVWGGGGEGEGEGGILSWIRSSVLLCYRWARGAGRITASHPFISCAQGTEAGFTLSSQRPAEAAVCERNFQENYSAILNVWFGKVLFFREPMKKPLKKVCKRHTQGSLVTSSGHVTVQEKRWFPQEQSINKQTNKKSIRSVWHTHTHTPGLSDLFVQFCMVLLHGS